MKKERWFLEARNLEGDLMLRSRQDVTRNTSKLRTFDTSECSMCSIELLRLSKLSKKDAQNAQSRFRDWANWAKRNHLVYINFGHDTLKESCSTYRSHQIIVISLLLSLLKHTWYHIVTPCRCSLTDLSTRPNPSHLQYLGRRRLNNSSGRRS